MAYLPNLEPVAALNTFSHEGKLAVVAGTNPANGRHVDPTWVFETLVGDEWWRPTMNSVTPGSRPPTFASCQLGNLAITATYFFCGSTVVKLRFASSVYFASNVIYSPVELEVLSPSSERTGRSNLCCRGPDRVCGCHQIAPVGTQATEASNQMARRGSQPGSAGARAKVRLHSMRNC